MPEDTTVPPDIAEKIREMVRRIVERFRPEKIILFGSHAAGTAGILRQGFGARRPELQRRRAGPDSDVDLLAVMNVDGSRRKKAAEIHLELAGVGLPKDVIVMTPQEVESQRDIVGTIVYPAVRQGKVLYEFAG